MYVHDTIIEKLALNLLSANIPFCIFYFQVWSIIQMGIFSWQTAVMKWLRDKIENRRVPGYNSYTLYDNRLGGGDWNENYITPEEKIYMGLPN